MQDEKYCIDRYAGGGEKHHWRYSGKGDRLSLSGFGSFDPGEGKLLKDIIAEQGIDGFLQVENEVNKSSQTKKTVIATGGSVVYGEEAMEHLKEIATIVYLSCPYDRLTRRLGDLKGRGVVLREGQTLRTIYEERCALYEKYADITVDEGMYDIEQTLEILLSVLREAKIEK